MISNNENPQNLSDFVNNFFLLLIGIELLLLIVTGWLLISPISIICINTTSQNITTSIFYNNSCGVNTTGLDAIDQLFSSSRISTIINEGLLNLFFQNFIIFLAIIGAFSLFCYFYYSITFNANVISEYSESQQKNPIIFFQFVLWITVLFLIYMILILYFQLHFVPIELALVFIFFFLEFSSACMFNTYSQIRQNYDDLVQFAAYWDYYPALDVLIYIISIHAFLLTFLILFFGFISDFNLFSIIFIVTLLLTIIWQINIIQNAPHRIFNIKIKENDNILQGFLLTQLERPIVQILVNDDKKIQIPKTSIDYVTLNREITKSEIVNPRQRVVDTIISAWNSLLRSKDFLLILGVEFGFLVGLFLYLGLVILNINFGTLLQILIFIFLIVGVVLGFIFGRSYQTFHLNDESPEEWHQYDEIMDEDFEK